MFFSAYRTYKATYLVNPSKELTYIFKPSIIYFITYKDGKTL